MSSAYFIASLISLWIGYLAGRQTQWAKWHGPIGAMLVVPLALSLGFDSVLSVLAPVFLSAGFLLSRCIA